MIDAAILRRSTVPDLRRLALCAAANARLCRIGRGLGGPAKAPAYDRERDQVEAEIVRRLATAGAFWPGAENRTREPKR